MSLRLTFEPIDSLRALSQSHIKVVSFDFLVDEFRGQNSFLDVIIKKASKEKTILKPSDFFHNKWMTGLTRGEYGVFMFEMVLKKRLIDSNVKYSNIILLDELSQNHRPFLGFRRGLNKELRELLNYR